MQNKLTLTLPLKHKLFQILFFHLQYPICTRKTDDVYAVKIYLNLTFSGHIADTIIRQYVKKLYNREERYVSTCIIILPLQSLKLQNDIFNLQKFNSNK